MRRPTPALLCIGETLPRLVAALSLVLISLLGGALAGRASNAPVLPAIVADIQSFRGRIAYSGHRADGPTQVVAATLTISADGWILEENSSQSLVHLSNTGSWLRAGSQTFVFDDPYEVDALVNSWAALLGSSFGATIAPTATSSAWSVNHRARVYLDPAQSEVIGVADTASADDISFAYNDWHSVNGLRLPQSIVRMRGGVTVASFVIDSYQVEWAPKGAAAASSTATEGGLAQQASAPDLVSAPATVPPVWRPYGLLFSLLFLGLGFVAWARRDALSERLCRRLADDPRGWRQQGTNVFVSPEGTLFFEGRPYHVGAVFYNQATRVQSSALFIRVSAPSVPRVLVLARRFPRPNVTHKATRAAAGFTLIEALTSAALFAVVIVGAVFPALIALAQADRVAAQHETANQVAANALADEEAALAYGTIVDAPATSTVDGLTLTETLTPAGISGLHNLIVQVADSSGHTLARIATMIGPPVPAPSATTPPD